MSYTTFVITGLIGATAMTTATSEATVLMGTSSVNDHSKFLITIKSFLFIVGQPKK